MKREGALAIKPGRLVLLPNGQRVRDLGSNAPDGEDGGGWKTLENLGPFRKYPLNSVSFDLFPFADLKTNASLPRPISARALLELHVAYYGDMRRG